MCLYTTQKEPKIADKDIICYKVLEKWNVESGRKRKSRKTILRSIYYPDFKWNMDKHYRSRLEVIKPIHTVNHYSVTAAFHSYQTLVSAKSYYETNSVESYIIVRCIIPKGAKYYEGMQTDGHNGYASNQMIMKEIVDFKELYPDFDADKYPYKQGQLLCISDSSFPNGEIMRVTNVIPLDSNTVRLRVGLISTYDTDINGIPVLNTVRIQIYNNKETK